MHPTRLRRMLSALTLAGLLGTAAPGGRRGAVRRHPDGDLFGPPVRDSRLLAGDRPRRPAHRPASASTGMPCTWASPAPANPARLVPPAVTEAVLVQPWTTAAAETGTGDQRLDHEYLAMDTNIRVTATYSTDKSLVRGILGARVCPPAPRPEENSHPPRSHLHCP